MRKEFYWESFERANIWLFWLAILVIPYCREICESGSFDVSISFGAFVEREFNFLGSHILITLRQLPSMKEGGYELASQAVMMVLFDHVNPVIANPWIISPVFRPRVMGCPPRILAIGL
jgi:hypothetical protein